MPRLSSVTGTPKKLKIVQTSQNIRPTAKKRFFRAALAEESFKETNCHRIREASMLPFCALFWTPGCVQKPGAGYSKDPSGGSSPAGGAEEFRLAAAPHGNPGKSSQQSKAAATAQLRHRRREDLRSCLRYLVLFQVLERYRLRARRLCRHLVQIFRYRRRRRLLQI